MHTPVDRATLHSCPLPWCHSIHRPHVDIIPAPCYTHDLLAWLIARTRIPCIIDERSELTRISENKSTTEWRGSTDHRTLWAGARQASVADDGDVVPLRTTYHWHYHNILICICHWTPQWSINITLWLYCPRQRRIICKCPLCEVSREVKCSALS